MAAALGHGRPTSLASSSPGPSSPTSAAQPPRRPSSTPSRNPISLRLYKVLASNFDDPSSLEALETVSNYYSTTSTANGVGLAGEEGEGAAEKARKKLREDAEERLAGGSRAFLDAFGDVDSVSSYLLYSEGFSVDP